MYGINYSAAIFYEFLREIYLDELYVIVRVFHNAMVLLVLLTLSF